MQYTVPHYYKKFSCTGSACPDTCCAGWQIQIDPASLKRYRRAEGPIGNRLRNEINWRKRSFRQYKGRCAFLNDENLCDLYLEGGGERAFCRTCRTYPRHIEEFEGLREVSLSLSCPAAAEIILLDRTPVHFLHAEDDRSDEEYPEFDFFLFTKLEDARSLMLQILQDRKEPFRARAAAVLALAHDLQQRIDRNALFAVDSLLTRYSSPGVCSWFSDRLDSLAISREERERTAGSLFVILRRLEVLRPDWKTYLLDARRTLKDAAHATREPQRPFHEAFTDVMTEQLLIYFIFTYFCGAVYNRNAYGKLKFALASTLLIRELVRAEWIKTNGAVSSGYAVEAAYRYAREVEHSDFNKCRMEEMLGDEEKFGLEQMFALL